MNPSNLITFFSVVSPIFGLLFYQLPLNKKLFYYFSLVSLSLLSVWLFVDGAFLDIYPTIDEHILCFYPLSVLVFIVFFNWKWGIINFNKTICLSLCLGYLLTEIHEIPAFILGYLHFFDSTIVKESYLVWFTPLSHLYSVVVGYLVVKISGLKINRGVIWLSFLCFIGLWFYHWLGQWFFHSFVYNFSLRIFTLIMALLLYSSGSKK